MEHLSCWGTKYEDCRERPSKTVYFKKSMLLRPGLGMGVDLRIILLFPGLASVSILIFGVQVLLHVWLSKDGMWLLRIGIVH